MNEARTFPTAKGIPIRVWVAKSISPQIWDPNNPQSHRAHVPRERSLKRADRLLNDLETWVKENQDG